jgi:hypothetical protein
MNSIVIKIYPPFSYAAGCKEIQILFKDDYICLEDAIKKMIDLYPKMSEFFPDLLDLNNLYGSCFPVRKGELLNLHDILKPSDIIEIFGSLDGG